VASLTKIKTACGVVKLCGIALRPVRAATPPLFDEFRRFDVFS